MPDVDCAPIADHQTVAVCVRDEAAADQPSFVMIGAIAIASIGFFVNRRIKKPLLELHKHLPTQQRVDRQLIIGSTMFGLGWGVAGFCPGPAIVAVGAAKSSAIVLSVAMLVGMSIYQSMSASLLRRKSQES